MLLLDEIREQPLVLERVLAENRSEVADAQRILESGSHVVIAARGSSDNAARYAKYVWGSRLSLPVTLAAPSLYTRYASPPRLDGAAVVGISQSGRSPDLLAVLREARRQGRPTVAIVNDLDSPLATVADIVIPLHAGIERSVAATKSYTASLLTVAMIAGDLEPLSRVPEATAATLAGAGDVIEDVAHRGPLSKTVVLGRGFNHATAFEWALKLQEMAYVFAHAFSTADFAHGPFAVLEEGMPVLALLPQGAVTEDSLAVLRRVTEEASAELSVITNTAIDVPSIVTPAIDEWLTPLTFIVAAQLHAVGVATANGVDPAAPRGLTKVTETS